MNGSSTRKCRMQASKVLFYSRSHRSILSNITITVPLTQFHKKLRLMTTIHGLPQQAKLRKAVANRCGRVLWRKARLEVATQAASCSHNCGSSMLIGCLLKDGAEQHRTGSKVVLHYPYATVAGKIIPVTLMRPRQQITRYSLVRRGQPLAGSNRQTQTISTDDLSLETNSSVTINLRKFRRQGRTFEMFTARLGVLPISSFNATPHNRCQATRSPEMPQANFSVFLDNKLVLHRSLPFPDEYKEDVDVFAVGLWQEPANKLRIDVRSTWPPSCIANLWKDAKLQNTEGPPRFKPCQKGCLRDQASLGRIYLSCFLDGCTNSTTKTDKLPYSRILLADPLTQIGIDRPGRWKNGNGNVVLGLHGTHSKASFSRAIGAHPPSNISFNLTAFRTHGLSFTHFSAVLGVDHASGCNLYNAGSVLFKVVVDGSLKHVKQTHHAWDTQRVMIDVRNSLELMLVTLPGQLRSSRQGCQPAVWANAMLVTLKQTS